VRGVASFARTLAFAAAAALSAPLALALLRPLLGDAGALAGLAIAVSAAYVFGLARRPARGITAALVLTLVCVALIPFGTTPLVLAGACAVLIGVLRSGVLRRDRRHEVGAVRAWAIEAVLIAGGLATGAWLARGSALAVPLAIWGFFLVQSGFFLIGGPAARAARAAAAPEGDPFERAQRRALELLDPTIHP